MWDDKKTLFKDSTFRRKTAAITLWLSLLWSATALWQLKAGVPCCLLLGILQTRWQLCGILRVTSWEILCLSSPPDGKACVGSLSFREDTVRNAVMVLELDSSMFPFVQKFFQIKYCLGQQLWHQTGRPGFSLKWVSLGKLFNLPKPTFLHAWNGENNSIYTSQSFWELSEIKLELNTTACLAKGLPFINYQ